MATLELESRIPVLATALVGVAMVAYAFLVSLTQLPAKSRPDGAQGPPVAPKGVLETLRSLGSPEAPTFMLGMAKECKSQIFKLNLPLAGGSYVIGDAKAQRVYSGRRGQTNTSLCTLFSHDWQTKHIHSINHGSLVEGSAKGICSSLFVQ